MLKTRDIIKLLEDKGFIFFRANKHLIYKQLTNNITVAVPNQRTCSKGLCRRILQQAGFLRSEINF